MLLLELYNTGQRGLAILQELQKLSILYWQQGVVDFRHLIGIVCPLGNHSVQSGLSVDEEIQRHCTPGTLDRCSASAIHTTAICSLWVLHRWVGFRERSRVTVRLAC